MTKNTLLYKCKLSLPQFLVVLYGFCYRWKYSDVRREADLDGQVRSVGVPESPAHWLQCLAYRVLREGSDLELVRKDRHRYLRQVMDRRKKLEERLKESNQ